ncbi:MAG: hypothetical protein VKJ64_10080 [Leptolyngbyaceae bacterium]|nr:hypothetical protein [Leptolyngbyaceae bacterium]
MKISIANEQDMGLPTPDRDTTHGHPGNTPSLYLSQQWQPGES